MGSDDDGEDPKGAFLKHTALRVGQMVGTKLMVCEGAGAERTRCCLSLGENGRVDEKQTKECRCPVDPFG